MIVSLYIIVFVILFFILYWAINDKKINLKRELKVRFEKFKIYNKIDEYINLLLKKQLINNYNKFVNPTIIITFSTILFILSFIIFNLLFKVKSTAIILALPCSFVPIIVIKFMLNKEKTLILRQLPMYIINIKNYVSGTNNIIKAIQLTQVEAPLKKYIEDFKSNISRGIDVIAAFDILKKDVSVKEFTEFINACQTCYLNGGEFLRIIEYYLEMITKENVHKESTKEKAYSGVLTLIVMLVLNIFVIFAFVFTNIDYSQIIRNTFLGRLILNFNAISYIFIAIIVAKLYKEE